MSWTEADWKQRNRIGSWIGCSTGLLIAAWMWLTNIYLDDAIGHFLSFCAVLIVVTIVSLLGTKIMFLKLPLASDRICELTRQQIQALLWVEAVGVAGGFIVWLTLGEHVLTMLPLCAALVAVAPAIVRIQFELREMRLAAKHDPSTTPARRGA